MSESFPAGAVSKSIEVLIRNPTTMQGLTGLVYNTSGFRLAYARDRLAPVEITKVAVTVTGAFVSGGFIELDAALTPGLYRVDVPNAAFNAASGVNKVRVFWTGGGVLDDGTDIDILPYDPLTPDKDGYTLSSGGNTAVAAAVAAPSAGTVATAVAAAVPTLVQITAAVPSTGQIASAVGAPSAGTIATAVAGAVPTANQIATAVAAAVPNAGQITAAVPTASQMAAAVMAAATGDGVSFVEWLRVIGAIIVGSATGLKTASQTFLNMGSGGKVRVTVTQDVVTGTKTIVINDKT